MFNIIDNLKYKDKKRIGYFLIKFGHRCYDIVSGLVAFALIATNGSPHLYRAWGVR